MNDMDIIKHLCKKDSKMLLEYGISHILGGAKPFKHKEKA